MNKSVLFTITIALLNFASFSQNIETLLKQLPNVNYTVHKGKDGFEKIYEVMVQQPLDHTDSTKGYFQQRVWLGHQSFDRPNVLVTEGYQSHRFYLYEPTKLLDANQFEVEHRFFGKSIPENFDYQFLTIEQAAADYHRIKVLFASFYKNNWLSTGISKGGETTIYYRYFYPEDVKASIPYVAPLALKLNDPRIYHFFDTVGTITNREKLYATQVNLLKHRKKSLKYIKKYVKKENLVFSYMSIERAFELAVLEYPFSFWQWNGDTTILPNEKASVKNNVNHLLEISNVDFYADYQMERLSCHYYQSGSQLGYYSYETKSFKGLLPELGDTAEVSAIFMPNNLPMLFNDSLPKKVFEWATKDASTMVYINGAIDPWASTAVPFSEIPDSYWFTLKGKHHGQARIKNMSESEKDTLTKAFYEWFKIDVSKAIQEL